MEYRVDPRSGNRLSVLGFGCMRFPRGVSGIDIKKTEQLILQAYNMGVNYFDTAYAYPGSEVALGEILERNGIRENVFIATKLPIGRCATAEDFDYFFKQHLMRLKSSYIDYYLLHNINSLAQWQQLCALGIKEWLQEKKRCGTARQIGFSYHGPTRDFLAILDSFDWDFCQIQYNYSNENYQAGVKGLRRAAEKNMPVIIMEPLLGGKLANGLPKQAVEVLRKENKALSCAAWGLRWLLNQSEVTVILSGMNSMAQLEDNIKTAQTCPVGSLTKSEQQVIKEVTDIFAKSYKIPCTGCGYCMPCPKGVFIPGCFDGYNASFAMGRIAGIMQYSTSTGVLYEKPTGASLCIECGRCKALCPQHIDIPKELAKVKKRMEPFYYTLGVKAVKATRPKPKR